MEKLNEEQLLLLSNLMYFRDSGMKTSVEEIALRAKEVVPNYDKGSMLLSGGFGKKPEQMVQIAEAIMGDKKLRRLQMVDSISTEGLHARCFADSRGNATVAVRGTGGSYGAWSDNVEGAYGTGTKYQKAFGGFMDGVGAKYSDITVTGHSKGGNLAQYAAIVNGEKIGRCVSFDGQGFGNEFCQKYRYEIALHSKKIKSVCGDKDYINILLTSVAGETVYLKTTEGENTHSSYALWERNRGTIENGQFANTTKQDWRMEVLDELVDYLVTLLNILPDNLEVPLVHFAGAVAGMIFSRNTGQLTLENLLDYVKKAMELHLHLSGIQSYTVLKLLEKPLGEHINEVNKQYRELKAGIT